MGDKIFNILKWFAITGIPVLTGFLAIAMPELGTDPEKVNSYIAILSAFAIALAGWLGLSNYNYYKPQNPPIDEIEKTERSMK